MPRPNAWKNLYYIQIIQGIIISTCITAVNSFSLYPQKTIRWILGNSSMLLPLPLQWVWNNFLLFSNIFSTFAHEIQKLGFRRFWKHPLDHYFTHEDIILHGRILFDAAGILFVHSNIIWCIGILFHVYNYFLHQMLISLFALEGMECKDKNLYISFHTL